MTSEYNCCLILVTCVESEAANHLDLAFVYQGYIECTVISVDMPTPHLYRKYAPPFSEGSFLKILW